MRNVFRADNLSVAIREVSRTHTSVTICTTKEEVAMLLRTFYPERNIITVTEPRSLEGQHLTQRLIVTEFDDLSLKLLYENLPYYISPIVVCSEEKLKQINQKLFPPLIMPNLEHCDNVKDLLEILSNKDRSTSIRATTEEGVLLIREAFPERNVSIAHYDPTSDWLEYHTEGYLLVVLDFKMEDLFILASLAHLPITHIMVGSKEEFQSIKNKFEEVSI